jgi:hypothetical protein
MEYMYKLAELQDYAMSNVYENIEMVAYSAVCFFLPLLMGHPQIVVGIAVNAMLVTAALNLKSYKLLPVILLPSMGVLSRGILFGPLIKFLIYFIPFIWAGNAILVFSFKHFKLKKKMNYWLTLAIGTVLKSGFLFLSALVLYKLSIVPAVFLTAMGLMQATTAILGGAAAYGIHYAKKSIA